MKHPRLEPLPGTQDGLRKFCIRHERRLWFRRLLVYIPLMAPASVFSPAWVLHFFGVSFSFWDVITSGVCLWLVLGCCYMFVGAEPLYYFLILAAAFYLIGLFVCLYRCIRPLFPWQPEIEKAPENGKDPETVLTRPHATRVEWKPNKDGSCLCAYFGVQLPADGYYAFEIVVDKPASPVDASMCSPFPSHYSDKEETPGLRSVHRFYGRFSDGVHTFHLFMDGTSAPSETLFTQLI